VEKNQVHVCDLFEKFFPEDENKKDMNSASELAVALVLKLLFARGSTAFCDGLPTHGDGSTCC